MIILLGLPKSGTTSFHVLFGLMGYRSFHWNFYDKYVGEMIHSCKLSHKPLLSFLPEDTTRLAITQMDICISEEYNFWPQVTDYQQLWTENPGAIYILNVRDKHKILDSWRRWNHLDHRILKYNPELASLNANIVANSTNLGELDQYLLRFIEKHYDTIREFLRSHNAKWIEYDIEKDNVEKLRKYIDIPAHINALPHENHNTDVI